MPRPLRQHHQRCLHGQRCPARPRGRRPCPPPPSSAPWQGARLQDCPPRPWALCACCCGCARPRPCQSASAGPP
eukprot:14280384-Alexandrium_andersonii.AAC.1